MRGIAATGAGVLLAAAAGTALGQGSVEDEQSTFAWANFGTEPGGGFEPLEAGFADFVGVPDNTFDNLNQHWFYFRTAGMGFERAFTPPDTQLYESSRFELGWDNLSGFSATLEGTLTDLGQNEARVVETLTLANPSRAPLELELFTFVDPKASQGFGDPGDFATLVGPRRVLVDDFGTFNFAEVNAVGATFYEASATAINVRDVLVNGVINNFDNSGLPLGDPDGDPVDVNLGFQWSLTIPASGQRSIDIVLTINAEASAGCTADLTGPGDPGRPDGELTADDFFFYLDLFAAGDPGADLTGPGGEGTPDGELTADDFFVYLDLFAQGCPS